LLQIIPHPKTPLPDTIAGFSESMLELSICEDVVQKLQNVQEESSEVITVLDSEEGDSDVPAMNENDEPPLLETNDSFCDCSSVVGSSTKVSGDSDTTVNKYFNNPPSADPNHVVSHLIIHNYRDNFGH
jgi:hypothetical protein